MTRARRLPPTWLMGAGFLPLGVFGSLMLITVPQLLAADHVPEQQIAAVTAIGLTPSFISVAISPILDWRLARRTYAIGLAVIAALCLFGALMAIRSLGWLTGFLFAGNMAVALCVSAAGGWFGNLTATEKKNTLGAWFAVFNIAGGGVAAAVGITLLRSLPHGLGEAAVGLTVLTALPLFLVTPCPPADGRLASESFRDFARDVLILLKRPVMLRVLMLFLAPCTAFALTNILGGVGRDFNTPEHLVGLIGGAGVAVAGVLGSLIVPPLAKRIPAIPLYLLVGGVGALFSLSLIPMPRSPVTFGLAFLGQNVFQAAAFAVCNLITLRAIGHDNPLAATQFSLLVGATTVPLSLMQIVDGGAYGWGAAHGIGGVAGAFLADAVISGAACLVLGAMVWRRRGSLAEI